MRVRLRVKEVAESKGISQGVLNRLANVDPKTIRKMYREPFAPASTLILARVATALGVSIVELIEELPDEQTEADE